MSTLTRQHFQSLAEALATSDASHETIVAVAAVCRKYNSGFQWGKFINYITNMRNNRTRAITNGENLYETGAY